MLSLSHLAIATLCTTGLYAVHKLRRQAQADAGRELGPLSWRRSRKLSPEEAVPDALRQRKLAAMTVNKLDEMQRQLTPMRDAGLNQRMQRVRGEVETLFSTIRNDATQLNVLARQLDDAVAGTQRFAARQRAANTLEAREEFAHKLDIFCAACARETALRTPPRIVPARPVPAAQAETQRPELQLSGAAEQKRQSH
ncbi:hypothetical protein ACX9MO_04920 [Pseudooceanicola sp. 502str34]|uniref:hypothetical protein n=1 Tax=Maritimibacter alkaliphilus TaxID=404236 RepID=UPI001C95188A|nr:hypothetical protein [Maritimibacter alkaliphilus]MBY6091180.1 hypothetical protein [Maritimibacter alkaliphilus]